MDDKALYLKAESEFNSNKKDNALWVKALTLSKGDKTKAKFTYIELRVDELNANSLNLTKKTSKEDDLTNLEFGLGILSLVLTLTLSYFYFVEDKINFSSIKNLTLESKKISENDEILKAIERQTQIQLNLAAQEEERIKKERQRKFMYNLGGAIANGGRKPSVTCKTIGNTTKCE